MSSFFDEQEKLKTELEESEYWPIIDVYVELEEVGTWVPARWENWEKPIGAEWLGNVYFVGYESDGLHAIELEHMRALAVPELEEGTKKINGIQSIKTGTKVRAVYLADRCWYGAQVVQVYGKRNFANVIFVDYNENQNTILPFLAIVDNENKFAGGAGMNEMNFSQGSVDDEEDEVVTTTKEEIQPTGQSEEAKVEEYVTLVLSGVPLQAVLAAAANDEVSQGLVRRRVEEAKRSGESHTNKAVARNAILQELESAQCLEDGFLRRVFDTYDTRKPAGQLTPMDFVDALKGSSSALARNALELFVEFDGDEDGGLDFDEFRKGIRRLVETEDSDHIKSLVWFWRAQQEDWYTGTGAIQPPVDEKKSLHATKRRNSHELTEMMVVMWRGGGGPREVAKPCLVRLESRLLTVWRLASNAEAHRTTCAPPISEAKYRGIVTESTVIVSGAKRAALRCDLLLTLDDVQQVRLWLPLEPRQRSRWITALDRCAAISRAQALLTAQEKNTFLEQKNLENDNNGEHLAQTFIQSQVANDDQKVTELRIVIWGGRGLIARDHSILSRAGTSDPYCRIFFEDEPELWRTTRVVFKNLDPVWNQCLSLPLNDPQKSRSFILVCADHDRSSRDDFMGSLQISIPAHGGLLFDKQWIPLTSNIPTDTMTQQLADTKGGRFSSKKPAQVSGEICISLARSLAPSIFTDPKHFQTDSQVPLLVGVWGAKDLATSFLKRKRNPRLICRVLGSNADDTTSVRLATTNPIWAEVLMPPLPTTAEGHIGDAKNQLYVLECIVEDIDTTSGKAIPIAGIQIPLRADAPFTLRKSDYLLQDPATLNSSSANASSSSSSSSSNKKKKCYLDLSIHWRPCIIEDE
uniref:Calmodulin n=1 Tax=Aureoumbra lagunensis TaxID=44058 RepID=A0A7S3JSI4_9STRA